MLKMKKILLSILMFCSCILSSIHFVNASSITVFKQTDSRWASYPYGYSNTAQTQPTNLQGGGCGILSYVNAIYYMNGQFIEPTFLADYSLRNGYRVHGVGTSHGIYQAFANSYGNQYGFKYAGSTSSYATLRNHLLNGGTAVGSVPDHLMAIVDYDSSNGKYLVLDSYRSSNRFTYPDWYTWQTESTLQGNYKTTFSVFYMFSPTGAVSPCNCSESYAGTYRVTTSSLPLTIRSGHGSGYSQLGTMPKDSTCTVTKADGSWAHVTYNGISGYASMEYLTKVNNGLPTNPSVTKNQYWYDITDVIELRAYADNANNYYMSMNKDGERIINGIQVESGHFVLNASVYGYGEYSAWFSCVNNNGYVDTELITFSVVGAPTCDKVSVSSSVYAINDVVEITVSPICADSQYIVIEKNGVGRVVAEYCDTSYKIKANQLGAGQYSVYFVISNGSGSIESSRVNFIIEDQHNYVMKNKKEPTCGSSGLITYECSYCKQTKTEAIAALGHNEVVDKAVSATCTSSGKTQGSHCSRCNAVIKAQTTVSALGHSWNNGTVTKTATCTSDGVKTFTCSKCNDSYTTTIYKLGHDYNSYYTIDTKATCISSGSKSRHCSKCNAKTDVTTISSTGCQYDDGVVEREASCMSSGLIRYTCENCGKSKTETIARLTHSYKTNVIEEATCLNAGMKEQYCTVCGYSKLEVIPRLSHTYKTVTTKATLSKNGKTEKECTSCGYVSKTTNISCPKTFTLSTTTYTYDGKVKKPSVKVKDSVGNILEKDVDYTLQYASGRKSTGKYAVTIKLKGKYSGKKTLYFNILPSNTSKITVSRTTSTIKSTWNKVTGASGYKVTLLNSSGKTVKTITTTKTTYTFKQLSKGKKYKVKVIAYKNIDSKKVYSKVSKTLSTSTKS